MSSACFGDLASFRRIAALVVFSMTFGLSACGDPEQQGLSQEELAAQADTLWCNARAVLSERCVSCHDGRGTGGSPMGLSTYSQMQADSVLVKGAKVWERMKVRLHADLAKAEGLTPM